MWKNYLKIAWRNLLKRKSNALINVLGLSTGMAVCLLLVLFIRDERSFDDFHENKGRIYRVVLERMYPGRSTSYSIIPANIGEAIKTEFPEVLECTRIFDNGGFGNTYVKIGDKIFEERNVLMADSNLFRVFSATMLAGNAATALEKPNSIVLNETTAKKYYGSVSAAIGKNLDIEGGLFVVTGVCKDWPANSHADFNMLISSSTFLQNAPKNYINFSAHTYLLLANGASAKNLEAKLPQIVEKYVAGAIEKNFSQTFAQFKAAGNGYHYYLQALQDIHLKSNLEAELKPNGSERAVSIFLVIAIFILVIACINFINLSTARSAERAREVGIRKTFGSERKSLISQFLVESTLISMISMIIAVTLVIALLPFFNNLSGKHLTTAYLFQPASLLLLFLLAMLVGLIAGIYPAFVLSSFKPILVLKGKLQSGKYGIALRNALVVFQFGVSVILIICTMVVIRQMNYVMGDKLGFNKDLVLTVERSDMLGKNTEAFKNEVLKISGVENISGTSAAPGTPNYFGISFQQEGSTETHTGRGLMVDEQFLPALSLQMDKGRFFSKSYGTDTLSIILNESAVTELGIKGNPLGARLTSPDEDLNPPGGQGQYIYTVAGILKDFHFQTLHEKIAPLYVINIRKFTKTDPLMVVKLKSGNFRETIQSIEKTWKKFNLERPFHYSFLDQKIADMYAADVTTKKIFSVFSILAILIACLGLLGLITYTIQIRTKEIGIRKVLGASISNILWLLGKNFFRIIILAGLIAFPLAWLMMNRWLEGFAYRINIGPWVFLFALFIAILVAAITICLQAIKAALANPVSSLRSE